MSEILEAQNLVAGYGSVDVLKGISFKIRKSKITCIIGPNGAGKSTIFKVIFGMLPTKEGEIFFNGEKITNFRSKERISKGISYVLQGRNVFPLMTVEENLDMGAYIRKDEDVKEDISKIYEKFPILQRKREQLAGNLSGGEQQILSIAMALLQKPKLLLLDEPSLGLQPSTVDFIFEEVNRMNKELKTTMLVIEQNARKALTCSDYAIVLDLGRIRFRGLSEEILNDKKVRELYLGA